MAFRFRRSLRIAPGFRLNFSKSGTSLSVGGKGLTVNVSERGTRTTVGIPGTGISYSDNESFSAGPHAPPSSASPAKGSGSLVFWVFFVVAALAWFSK